MSQWLNLAFPGYRGISWRKNKGKLTWQREKKTQPVEDVYLLTSLWMVIFQHLPAMLAKLPEGGGSSFPSQAGRRSPPKLSWFQLLCDSRPFSESPLLSAWGEAKRPGDGAVGPMTVLLVGLGCVVFLGWGLRKGWKKPNIPTTQCIVYLPTFSKCRQISVWLLKAFCPNEIRIVRILGYVFGVSFEWYRGMTNTKKSRLPLQFRDPHKISYDLMPGDSKWPLHPLVEGHLAFERVT